mmetsp:Transcript_5704/g.9701  ORF Transcript_5704/g.9701 Transcript_5704/m.9701 type:complete len:397 (-) Transcript_5704:409-1599(-)
MNSMKLVAVVVRFVRAFSWQLQVIGLFFRQFGQFDAQFVEVQARDFLVKFLWQRVHAQFVVVFPDRDLCQCLIGERVGHDKRRVTSGATEIDQTTLCQQNDLVAIRECVRINLRFDVDFFDAWVGFQSVDLDFVIKVTDVANDSVVLHFLHVFNANNVFVASGGDKDVSAVQRVLQRVDFIAVHGGLQRADRVDLGHNDAGALAAQRGGRAFAHVAKAAHHCHFTADHHISGAVDAVDERVTAAVHVVEFRFGDRVVDVDGWEQQFAGFQHLIQTVNASGGLFRHAFELFHQVVKVAWVLFQNFFQDFVDTGQLFRAFVVVQHFGVVLGFVAAVDQERGVAAVVNDHVRALAVAPVDGFPCALPVLFQRLAFPRKHWRASDGNGGGGVVLCRVNVA